jgi:phytoene dehydrogenase-like protein
MTKPPKVRIGARYRAGRTKPTYDAIIIGSGPGGLAAASSLAKMGKRVIVLEQHYTIGGGSHAYARAGYKWDIGLHFINDMITPGSPMAVIGDFVSGGRMRWAPMSNEFVYSIGQSTYRIPFLSGEKTKVWFQTAFPDEAENFERFLVDFKQLARGMGPSMGLSTLAPAGAAGHLMRALARQLVPGGAARPVEEQLAEYFTDKNLIACISSMWVAFGVPPRDLPFFAVAALSVIDNQLCYPDGGGEMIGRALVEEIENHGGDVFAYALVNEILLDGRRAIGVRMDDGSEIMARAVISNAGARNTFERLLPPDAPYKAYYRKKLEAVEPSLAHLNLFVGIDADADTLGLTDGEHIVDGALDLNEAFAAFGADMKNAPIPNVFFAFPSMKDPSFRKHYPGKTTATMIAYIDNHDGFQKWANTDWGQRGVDYEALKEHLAQKLLAVLIGKFPQLEGHIDFYELSTPLSTQHFFRAPKGEALGAGFNTSRFGGANWLSRKTRIKGLYMAGQDTLAMGFTPALMSGVLAAGAVLGWHDKRRLFKAIRARAQNPSVINS